MAQRLISPFVQMLDDASVLRDGARLFFYASGTSAKQATYSDASLTTLNPNPIELNEFGQPTNAVFGLNLNYKIVLAGPDELGTDDPPTNVIRTIDPVSGNDFATFLQTAVGSGSPNGVVAGTAASPGVLPSTYWDYTNFVLYICTSTGNAASATWIAVNAVGAAPAVPAPQGRLTLTSGARVITGDVAAATAIYYTPAVGNLVPIYDGAKFVPIEFNELSFALHASHALNTLYDLFVFNNAGVITVVSGPAWTTSTAGSGARGTGGSTTQLTRLKGLDVNAVTITGRNGATTYSIGANLATYLGTFLTDGTAGQVTCHTSYGQSRKWGLWNSYNRLPVFLRAGDSTSSWSYASATLRPFNNASANSLTLLSGLAEEYFDLQAVGYNSGSPGAVTIDYRVGIGVNSTTVASGLNGHSGGVTVNSQVGFQNNNARAQYVLAPALGSNVITGLEASTTAASLALSGGEANNLITARYQA